MEMIKRISPITCSSCGTTIKVTDGQKEATCVFCNHTQLVAEPTLQLRVDKLERRVSAENAVLAAQNRLDDLHREWAIKQQRLYFQPLSDRPFEPTSGTAVLYMLLALSVFIVIVGAASEALVMMLIVFVGGFAFVAMGWNILQMSGYYAKALAEYKQLEEQFAQTLDDALQQLREVIERDGR